MHKEVTGQGSAVIVGGLINLRFFPSQANQFIIYFN